LLQELVAQFLAHDGYVGTARAFAEEVAAESAALESSHKEPLKKYEVEEDVEAINRQSMLSASSGFSLSSTDLLRNPRLYPRRRYR
jgi:hypothetical protein